METADTTVVPGMAGGQPRNSVSHRFTGDNTGIKPWTDRQMDTHSTHTHQLAHAIVVCVCVACGGTRSTEIRLERNL